MKNYLMRVCLLWFTIGATLAPVRAQEFLPSIHERESAAHRSGAGVTALSVAMPGRSAPLAQRTSAVTKKVFGYHPYWVSSSAYLSYDYSVLSTIGYFSYEVNTATGGYTTTNGWSTTPIIAYAHARGVRVVIVVTNFGAAANTAILSDTVKQNTLINTLVTLLMERGGDGVNIDFEGVPAAQRANLVSFMRKLAAAVKDLDPSAEISMASPAVDWSNAWDLAALSGICDYLFLMGYDYYWSGSTTAGPVCPLEGENYQVTRSVTTYLAAGVQAEKIILGTAWYGYDWPVASDARKAAASASASSGTFTVLEAKAQSYGKRFDASTRTPWFTYQSGTQWHQAWYDDSLSLSYKYALANTKNLGGVGMWALSYNGQRPELWQGLHASFTATSVRPSSSTPANCVLGKNYPNPFNPSTTISFTLAARSFVSVKIFNTLGRAVSVLVADELPAGTHARVWDASAYPSGIYFCRMTAGAFSATTKLVLQK